MDYDEEFWKRNDELGRQIDIYYLKQAFANKEIRDKIIAEMVRKREEALWTDIVPNPNPEPACPTEQSAPWFIEQSASWITHQSASCIIQPYRGLKKE